MSATDISEIPISSIVRSLLAHEIYSSAEKRSLRRRKLTADASVRRMSTVEAPAGSDRDIASWSYGLIRDTGAILLDMTADRRIAKRIRETVESAGDELEDLHLWRLGPGGLGVILEINTRADRGPEFSRARLARFSSLSHVTVEVDRFAVEGNR
jgi:hypothetical protein